MGVGLKRAAAARAAPAPAKHGAVRDRHLRMLANRPSRPSRQLLGYAVVACTAMTFALNLGLMGSASPGWMLRGPGRDGRPLLRQLAEDGFAAPCLKAPVVGVALHCWVCRVLFHVVVAALDLREVIAAPSAMLRGAFWGVLCFALHPLRAEAVLQPEHERVLLAALALLYSFRAVLRLLAAEQARPCAYTAWYALALGFYAAAAFFGGPSLALAYAAAVALYDMDHRAGKKARGELRDTTLQRAAHALKYAPMVALSFAMRRLLPPATNSAAAAAAPVLGKEEFLRHMAARFALPIWHTIYPRRLASFYPCPSEGFEHWQFAAMLTVLLMLTAVSVARQLRRAMIPAPLCKGWIAYLALVAPAALGLDGWSLTRDWHAYLPSMVFVPLLAYAIAISLNLPEELQSAPGRLVSWAMRGVVLLLIGTLCLQTAVHSTRFSDAAAL
mmetsp:Transcript_8992/g.26150  ORF Transcript_8992/g.26150 Transcript_8992/m.26150 type:complete len:444 (-) Transcript_8992:1218-2549(-)|eukprot:CAMPEP_0118854456 /NCGR_PEP_ID=MMETSP1163-20130328/2667_1 /TAXON_ID=124430 /ORGANISM="Phaeomonas parva, Strain CCMP2877" /LENGTH=443 /DNA_ID=CAMNT_0006787187 /DNA_START=182 /DNA_END=1513 /DNA_ORIENTATION=+